MKSDFKKVTKKAIETGKSAFDEATEQISDVIEVAANHGKRAFDQVPILTEEIISGGKKVAGETADHVSDAILKTKSQVAAYAKKILKRLNIWPLVAREVLARVCGSVVQLGSSVFLVRSVFPSRF